MNHIDFVIWVIGWGLFQAHVTSADEKYNDFRVVVYGILWIIVAIALWRAS
jgi:hypothetical protein